MSRQDLLRFATVLLVAGICCACDQTAVQVDQPASQPTTPTVLQSFKGWELYAWREGDTWQFSLLAGTNRNKSDQEIVATVYRLEDVAAVRMKLSELARDEFVTFMPRKTDGPLPPKQVQEELEHFCSEHALHWQSTFPGEGT